MWNIFGGKNKNKHHIIPKSRADEGFDVHKPENITLINTSFHNGLHQSFGNATPKEQFELLGMCNKKVMSRKAKRTLDKLTSMKDSEFYDKDLLL